MNMKTCNVFDMMIYTQGSNHNNNIPYSNNNQSYNNPPYVNQNNNQYDRMSRTNN